MHELTTHLTPETFALSPGAEWVPPVRGWWILKVDSGAGYLLSSANQQFESGAAIRISPSWSGRFRASQIGPLVIKAFQLEPARLLELVSLPDVRRFASAARDPSFALRIFPSDYSISHALEYLFKIHKNPLLFRVTALQIFLETFENSLPCASTGPAEPANHAAFRLERILRDIPSADLIHISVEDLVNRVHCTPRHFSRLFRDLVGVSFREKQTEIRLNRAVQLLAQTDSKVIDVAFESGFGSVSLFNSLFKRRYSVPPRVWRARLHRENRVSPSTRI